MQTPSLVNLHEIAILMWDKINAMLGWQKFRYYKKY